MTHPEPTCTVDASHGPAKFPISCNIPGEAERMRVNVCKDCLSEMCESLKDEGATFIIIAEPANEARILAALKAASSGQRLPR